MIVEITGEQPASGIYLWAVVVMLYYTTTKGSNILQKRTGKVVDNII